MFYFADKKRIKNVNRPFYVARIKKQIKINIRGILKARSKTNQVVQIALQEFCCLVIFQVHK